MASVNKAILIGNLGKDPEVRYMPSGGAVTNITLATSDTWRDKQTGEQKERMQRRLGADVKRQLKAAAPDVCDGHRDIGKRLHHRARGRDRHQGADVELKVDPLKHRTSPESPPAT